MGNLKGGNSFRLSEIGFTDFSTCLSLKVAVMRGFNTSSRGVSCDISMRIASFNSLIEDCADS